MQQLIQRSVGIYFNVLAVFSKRKAAEKAFSTFCTVRKGKVAPQQKEFLDPAKGTNYDIASHQIQTYRWPGAKDTVLLIHGWESNTFRWRALINHLQAENFNIIAFDGPAHGYSSGKELNAPLYAEILQHMITTYTPAVLIGHSFGGMAALYNEQLNQNASVDRIVSIAAPSEFRELMDHYQQLLQLNRRVMDGLDRYVTNRFGFRIHEFSTSKFAKEITAKGLILHDRLDQVTPYHGSKNLHQSWPESQLMSTEGLGHSMHQESVNERIVDFLES